jgi:hypothetical protein
MKITAGSSLAAKVKMARMKRLASPYLHRATKDPPYYCNMLHNQSMTMTHDAHTKLYPECLAGKGWQLPKLSRTSIIGQMWVEQKTTTSDAT